MKFIKKFNESSNEENQISIYDILTNIIDIVDNYEVYFTDINGGVKYPKSIDEKTKFVFNKDFHNINKSKFMIVIQGSISLDRYVSILDKIVGLKEILSDDGWLLSKLSNENTNSVELDIEFSKMSIVFTKPDEIIEQDKTLEKNITVSNLIKVFLDYRIDIKKKNIIYHDEHIDIMSCYEEDKFYIDLNDIVTEIGAIKWEWFDYKTGIRLYF